jgi:hypothetical protein
VVIGASSPRDRLSHSAGSSVLGLSRPNLRTVCWLSGSGCDRVVTNHSGLPYSQEFRSSPSRFRGYCPQTVQAPIWIPQLHYGASGYSVGDLGGESFCRAIRLHGHVRHPSRACASMSQRTLMADALNPPSHVEVAANDCQGRPRSGDLEWIQIPRVQSSDGTGTDQDSPVALRRLWVLRR